MKLQVVGEPCPKCHALAVHAGVALRGLGLDVPVEEIEDPSRISALDGLTMPALILDGRVVSSGKVLSSPEIEELLEEAVPA